MATHIKIVIDQDGSATVGVAGVKGKSCTVISKAIEEALGKTESRKPTSEMYEAEDVKVRH